LYENFYIFQFPVEACTTIYGMPTANAIERKMKFAILSSSIPPQKNPTPITAGNLKSSMPVE